jgi:hypothetical protein
MKRIFIKCALAFFAATAAGTVAASEREQPVWVNTSGLQSHVAEQIKMHAAQGEAALSYYLARTRKMNQLVIEDLTRPQSETAADSGNCKPVVVAEK